MSLVSFAIAAALTISHEPVDCLVKGRTARIGATVSPAEDVAGGRVYFKYQDETEPYAVEMVLRRGVFEARLPEPKDTGAIVYFIEILGQDGSVRRTMEMEASVVRKESACPRDAVVAPDAGDNDVVVLAAPGSKKPKGFDGISKVQPIGRRAATTVAEAAVPDAAPVGPASTPQPTPAPPKAAAAVVVAQAPPAATAPAATAPAVTTPVAAPAAFRAAPGPEDYRVGPGDVLRINVYGYDDLAQVVTIETDGTFTFPLIGRVAASNVTLRDLQANITTALGKGFVRNPQVTVVVQEYHSQSVFVVGEVSRPGTYALQGVTTVVEILAKAGPTQNAGHEVVIVRPRAAVVDGPILPTDVDSAGDSAEVIRVNVREIRMGKLEQNVVLRSRDTVFVSEAAKVFVSGEVKSGGAYTFNPGMTVRQGISMAGGFTAEASSGRIHIVRGLDGKMREVKVKLDDPLEPGDTIVVKAKRF